MNNVHLVDSPTFELDDNDNDEFDDEFDDLDFSIFKTLILKDMHDAGSVGQILDVVGGSDLHIIRCALPDYYDFEGNVSLVQIDVREDLLAFLTDSPAKKLVINRCPGFGDEILNAMMAPEYGAYRDNPSCAPLVQDLSILNCPDFSISTLKKVVETRRIHSMTQGSDHIWPTRIDALRLSGRVPDVSPEDRDWFKGCLSEFSYDPSP
jgi:hypothetical protein